jgi:hypothetical protein
MPNYPRAASSRWRLLAVAAITAVALAVPATASAATTVSKFSFKGTAALASFYSVDGCIQTEAYVTAVRGEVKNRLTGHTSSSLVDVIAVVYDRCQDTTLRSYYGPAVELAPEQFSIGQQQSTATLTASVPVYDFVSGTTTNLAVDLTWTAISGPVSEKSRYTRVLPDGSRYQQSFSGITADASATATVSDGSINFTPSPSQSAVISSTKSGSLEIIKP